MKAKELNAHETLSYVQRNEVLNNLFNIECTKRGLRWSSQLQGGCKIGNKKVGIQKFHHTQLEIARIIYSNHADYYTH